MGERPLCGRDCLRDERGIALVASFLILLLLSVVAAGLMVTAVTDTQLASYQLRDTQAMTVAEAGIEEAIHRLRLDRNDPVYGAYSIGDTSNALNPAWTTFILLSEDLPPSGPDTFYVSSLQMDSPQSPLLYSTVTADTLEREDVLIVHHKTNPAGDSIYFLDLARRKQFLAPPDYPGSPVEVIEVTGRAGTARRRVLTEVARRPVDFAVYGALHIRVPTRARGTFKVCGHEHHKDLPVEPEYEPPNCEFYHVHPCTFPNQTPPPDCWAWTDPLCYETHCSSGFEICVDSGFTWNGAPTSLGLYGNPALRQSDALPFYEIWEMLNFDSAEEMNRVVKWRSDPGMLYGPVRIEGEDLHISGEREGSGVLWLKTDPVTGDGGNLDITGTLRFKGLIYCDNDLMCGGNILVVGGMAVKGENVSEVDQLVGTCQICLSREAIREEVEKITCRYLTLFWREK